MTHARRFSVSTPDWGQAHLSPDAVVAYVDDELAAGAHARAEAHLAGCAECRADVAAQRQARTALRAAAGPSLPSSLLTALRAIPRDAPLPAPPPGLAVAPDGALVSVLRPGPEHGPDALPAGLPAHPHEPRGSGRRRAAAAVVVSGIAFGAIALAASDAVVEPHRGVFGGPVLDARLPPPAAGDPAAGDPPGVPDELVRQLGRLPSPFPPGLP